MISDEVHSIHHHRKTNGAVECLHVTLVSIIQKYAEDRIDWSTLVPLALYFIRMTPNIIPPTSLCMAGNLGQWKSYMKVG